MDLRIVDGKYDYSDMLIDMMLLRILSTYQDRLLKVYGEHL